MNINVLNHEIFGISLTSCDVCSLFGAVLKSYTVILKVKLYDGVCMFVDCLLDTLCVSLKGEGHNVKLNQCQTTLSRLF